MKCIVLNCSIAFPNETSPIAVHFSMFIPTLESQTTPEQKEKWLPKALAYEIIGAFAQTELGHGNWLVFDSFICDQILTLDFDYDILHDI